MTLQNISFTQTDISGITSLLFEEKTKEVIGNIIPEVEVRFGKIETSGKPYFNSDIGEKRFKDIIGRIEQLKSFISSR
jgi:hypothetical protein